jgi:hypothetical protein
MAEGTRMHHLLDSVKECQDAIAQQHITNDNVRLQLREFTDMLQTVLANQAHPALPPLVVGQDDRRQHELERQDD